MSAKTPPRVIPDVETCIDCGACNVACKDEWDLEDNNDRIAVVTHNEGREGGRFESGETSVPMSCYHCAEAPCMEVCPTDALQRDEHGLVQVEKDDCIGCSYCTWACPFGATQFPEETSSVGNAGTMDKCTGCAERIEEDENPVCFDQCPTDALLYGTPAEIANQMREGRSSDMFTEKYGDIVFGGSL